MSFFIIALLLVLPLSSVLATVLPPRQHGFHHNVQQRLPSAWYHEPDNPVHRLFRRGPADYAPVGSPEWSSGFQRAVYDPSSMPKEWKDALDDALKAGKIQDIPPSNNTPGTNPVYPPGVNPISDRVCSATYQCRHEDDIWDAPPGVFGSGFDDGPQPFTPKLAKFLESKNLTTTHFLIGTNILYYPNEFRLLFDRGDDFAVHTWTHPYMTTLSNLRIVAELGWTMLLIHNSTGGFLPKYWRPPYGDADNRVRAIAKEVFGLTTIMWNQDARDWSLVTGGTTTAIIHRSMQSWTSGPKSPGLIVLEHETSEDAVNSFIDAYPMIVNNGWNIMSVTRFANESAYQDPATAAASSAGSLMDSSGPLTTSDITTQASDDSQTPPTLSTLSTTALSTHPSASTMSPSNQQRFNSGGFTHQASLIAIGGIVITALHAWL
ncbi:carbohydrate esterase family 4 protein [Amanita muscaria]